MLTHDYGLEPPLKRNEDFVGVRAGVEEIADNKEAVAERIADQLAKRR